MSRKVSLRAQIRAAAVVMRQPARPWYGKQLCQWSGLGTAEVSHVMYEWRARGLITPITLNSYTVPLFMVLHDRGCHWHQLTPCGVNELGRMVDHVQDVLRLLIGKEDQLT